MGAAMCCVERKDTGWEVCCLAGKDDRNAPARPGELFSPPPQKVSTPREATVVTVKSRDIDLGEELRDNASRPTTVASSEAGDETLADLDCSSTRLNLEPETAAQHHAHVERLSLIANLLHSGASSSTQSAGGSEATGVDDTVLEGEELEEAEGPSPTAPEELDARGASSSAQSAGGSEATGVDDTVPEGEELEEAEGLSPTAPEELDARVERPSLDANLLESRPSGSPPSPVGEPELEQATGGEASGAYRSPVGEPATMGGSADRRSRIASGSPMHAHFGLATTFFLSHDVHRLRMNSSAKSETSDEKLADSPGTPASAVAALADESRQKRKVSNVIASAQVTEDPAQTLSY